MGIWAWDSNRVVVQHNRSYRNRIAGTKDGGGFDLDGGVTHSVMQYNLSYENDGAGFMLMQFPGRPHRDNVVRYNISYNDGRKNGFSGIALIGGIEEVAVLHNSVFVAPAGSGEPSAVLVAGVLMGEETVDAVPAGARIRNNVFRASGGLPVIRVDRALTGIDFEGNVYFADGAAPRIAWSGATYEGLEAWRAATTQESNDAGPTGMVADPRWQRSPLWTVGSKPAIADDRLAEAFRMEAGSPLIDAGLASSGAPSAETGERDFFGTPLPQRRGFDVGAHELKGAP